MAIAGIAVVTFALGTTDGLAFLAVPAVALGLWATGGGLAHKKPFAHKSGSLHKK